MRLFAASEGAAATASVQIIVEPGQTYFVAPSGNNSNSGTELAPWATIAYGAAQLGRGDTLLVKGNNTTPYDSIDASGVPAPGFDWASPTTIQAYPGDTPLIAPNGGAGNWGFRLVNTSYVVIRGFEIDGTDGEDCIKLTYTGTDNGLTVAHHIRIQECNLHHAGQNVPLANAYHGSGIIISGSGCDGCEFIDIETHHNGLSGHDHGIYMRGKDHYVKRVKFYENAGYGLHLYNDAGEISADCLIEDCFSYHNGWVGSQGSGFLTGNGPGHTLINCISLFNRFSGFVSQYDNSSSANYYNCTAVRNEQRGFRLYDVGHELYNCLSWGNGGGFPADGSLSSNFTVETGATWSGSNNWFAGNTSPVQGNPGLVDQVDPTEPEDVKLGAGSPCIGAGITLVQVPRDYADILRTVPYDIGAWKVEAVLAGRKTVTVPANGTTISNAAWATLQTTINNAPVPSKISVAPGTYTATAPIVPRNGVWLTGAGVTINTAGFLIFDLGTPHSDIWISGFTLNGVNNNGQTGNVYIIGGTNIHIVNMSFLNHGTRPIIFYGGNGIYIQGNYFESDDPTGSDGNRQAISPRSSVGTTCDTLIVSDNEIVNSTRFGIETVHAATHTNMHFDRNLIRGIGSTGMSIIGDNYQSGTVWGNEIRNRGINVPLVGWRGGGIELGHGPITNITCANNYIHDNVGPGLQIAQGPGSVYENNILNANGAGPFQEDGGYIQYEWVGVNTIDGVSVTGWPGKTYGTKPAVFSPSVVPT